VQGTVADFHPDGSGRVLLDDGTPLGFDAAAFAASGLRLLRSGQRVRLRVAGEGVERRVTALTIVTLPLPD
jgi:cold shock CspA family protein